MKKWSSASNVMRIVSIVGVLCLLALQWIWWKNAYKAVATDFLSKSESCINIGVENAMIHLLDPKSKGFKVVNESAGEKYQGKLNRVSNHYANNTTELKYVLEEGLNFMKKPLTDTILRKYTDVEFKKKFGFVPTYAVQIVRDSVQIIDTNKQYFNRIAIGYQKDTIYQQFGFNDYMILLVDTPTKYYLKQNTLILVASMVLVVVVGSLIFLLFANMQRDKKFTLFIKDYTRMFTHELRTPLSGMYMVLDLIRNLKPNQKEIRDSYVQECIHQTKKLMLNLDNILYMAISEKRTLEIYREELVMSKFIEPIVESYRLRKYDPKVVQIMTSYDPVNFNCRFDRTLMGNALCNLLENAIKYTDVDARISIDCRKRDNVVELKVRDNGMGIKETDLKKIFNLFERGSDGRNKMFEGFGIGLHFVEQVVKAHGGTVSIQSHPNEGTEVTIRYISEEDV
jgi:two-component system phosphate regulon sensor histidine kinase PhoR